MNNACNAESECDTSPGEESAESYCESLTWSEQTSEALLEEESREPAIYMQKDEDLLDTLEAKGLADELLESWERIELRSLSRCDSAQEELIPRKVRKTALWCLFQAVNGLHLPLDSWFNAAAILDAHLRHASSARRSVQVFDLPVLCTALLRMQWKEEFHVVGRGSYFPLAELAQSFASFISRDGFEVAAVSAATPAAVSAAEHDILNTLQGRLNLPNVDKWTTVLFKRLSIFMGEQHPAQKRIQELWQHCLFTSQGLVVNQVPSLECSPQRMARGLFVMCAAHVQLFPQLHSSDPKDDLHLVTSDPGLADSFLKRLEGVAHAPAHELRKDWILVNRLLAPSA